MPHRDLRRQWPALYHVKTRRLFIITQHSTQVYSRHGNKFHLRSGTRRIPRMARPATVRDSNNGWILDGHHFRTYYPAKSIPPESFLDHLQSLEPWEAVLFHTVEMSECPFTIVDLLTNNTFLGVSDGSVRFQREGAFGWVISLSTGRRLVRCAGPVFGFKPTSYRAEAYGLLSMLRYLVQLALYCGVPNLGGCSLFSDNLALVNITKAFKPHIQTSPNATLASDWDVINEIHHNLYHNVPPFKQTIAHVKGHQDKTVEYEKLPLAAQLNVDADHMAGQFQDEHGREHPFVYRFPHNRAQLNLPGGTITYN